LNDSISIAPEQSQEIIRCLISPEYFIETFCWLQQKASAGVAKSSAVIPFIMGKTPDEPHHFQRRILNCFIQRKNVVTLKHRRVGCSWIAAAYAAWLINFHESVNILFISETGLKAKQILEKVKFILNNLAYHDSNNIRKATLAPWLKGEVYTDNSERLSICYRNDDGSIRATSDVLSLNNTDNTGAGDDATFIVFDELDLYEHPDETWGSALPTLTMGGHWMAISTPRKIGRVFHRLCARGDLAELGKLDGPINFEYFKIHYREAGITDEQVEAATEGMTQDKKEQEWGWKFMAPGTVAFSPTHLAACYKPLKEYPEIADFLNNYADKVKAGNGTIIYYGGADTAMAKQYRKKSDMDYHAFTALTGNGIQAGAYQSKEALSKWAGQVVDDGAGQRVEVLGTLSRLHAQFPGVLYIEEDGPGLVAIANHQLPEDGFSEIVQVGMKHYFKRGIVEKFILKIENHLVTITDPFTYQCLSVFQQLGPGKYGAPEGSEYYDDPVIAILLASTALDAYGMMDIPWGSKVERSKDTPAVEAEELFTSGPVYQLTSPQTIRASETIGGSTRGALDDYNAFQWMVSEDDENFAKVAGDRHHGY
jgi:hypothetical protein